MLKNYWGEYKMVKLMPITDSKEFKNLRNNYIPDLTSDQAEMIKKYWSAFWDNPEEFKDTDLKDIIVNWTKTKKWVSDNEISMGTPPRKIVDIKEDETILDDFRKKFFDTIVVSKEDAERQIKEGRVPFDEFYKAASRFIELDDYIMTGYEVNSDGSVTIEESVMGIIQGHITISRNGDILSDMNIPYIKTLRENNVKVDLSGITGSAGYKGVDLSVYR